MSISALSRAMFAATVLGLCTLRAFAGPPYHSDDPEPTDYTHYEIYAFTNGTVNQDGTSGAAGIDFNYGGAPNLQLTATLPEGYAFPSAGQLQAGLSNIELAAKYRFYSSEFRIRCCHFPASIFAKRIDDRRSVARRLSFSSVVTKRLEQMVGVRWRWLRNQPGRKLAEFLSRWGGRHQPDHLELASWHGNLPSNIGHSGRLRDNLNRHRRSLRLE